MAGLIEEGLVKFYSDVSEFPKTGNHLAVADGQVYAVSGGIGAMVGSGSSSGVPDGGVAGQVLLKQSSTDGDADWANLAIANITNLNTTLTGKVSESLRNQPNGFAGLDTNGNLVADIVPRTDTRYALSQLTSVQGELASATDYPSIFKYTGALNEPDEFIDFKKTAEIIVQDAPIIAKRIHSVSAASIEGSKYGDVFVGLSSVTANTTTAFFSEDGQHWRRLPALPVSAKWKISAKRSLVDDYVSVIACQTVAHQYVYFLRCQWADLSDPTKTLTWVAVDMSEVKLWSALPGILRNWVYPSSAETTTSKVVVFSEVGNITKTLALPSSGTWISRELENIPGAIDIPLLINLGTKAVAILQYNSTLEDYNVAISQSLPETPTASAKILYTKNYIFVLWSTNGTYFDKCYRAKYSISNGTEDVTQMTLDAWDDLSANLSTNLLQLTTVSPIKSVFSSSKIIAGLGSQGLAYTEDGVSWQTKSVSSTAILGCYDNAVVFGNSRDQKYRLEIRVLNTLTSEIVTITAPLQWYAEASTLTTMTNKLIGNTLYSGNLNLVYTSRISGGQPETIQQYFRRVSTMAATLYIPCDCSFYILDPTTVYSSSTISLPYASFDGQTLIVVFGGTITTGNSVITTLAWTNGTVIGTMPSTAVSGQSITLRYCLANNIWYVV